MVNCINCVDLIACRETRDFEEEEADEGEKVGVACVPEDPADTEFEDLGVLINRAEEAGPPLEREEGEVCACGLFLARDIREEVSAD